MSNEKCPCGCAGVHPVDWANWNVNWIAIIPHLSEQSKELLQKKHICGGCLVSIKEEIRQILANKKAAA